MDSLYIIIPAYNEEANLKTVIDQWYPVVEAHSGGGKSRLVIIDDGSKDGTFALLEESARERPLLVPLHKANSGHGATVLYGYQYALQAGADYIFQTDSDGQTLPEEFPPFWAARQQQDMVIGWRNARQDGLARVVVTWVLQQVIRLCFHVKVTDANTPYRLMKAETLGRYIGMVPEGFNLSNVLIATIYEKKGLATLYLPITFRPRQGGENSINLKSIFRIGKKALSDFRALNKALKGEA